MPVDRRQLLTFATAVLWTAFLLLPVAGWGVVDGVPIRSTEAAVLAAIWWTWWVGRIVPGGAWLPIALLAAKLVVVLVTVPHGFDATYFANASWIPPHERSVEWRGSSETRRDTRLAFTAPDGPELPLHFFHDNGRFNVGTRAEREGLPFSIVWSGHWRVQTPATMRLYVEGAHLAAAVLIDDGVVLEKPAEAATAERDVPIAAGWRRLVVRVSAPHGRARAFEAGIIDGDGARVPFGTSDVYPAPSSLEARAWDARARGAGTAAGTGIVVLVGLWTAFVLVGVGRSAARAATAHGSGRAAAALSLAIFVALADAWWFAKQVEGRVLLLLGGDDMLTYATLARDIALNGPLMLGGQPLGEAAPFYYQPLYPYVLALTHLVFSEDGFGIFLLQRLGLWVTLLAVWRTSARLFGAPAGWLTLGASAVFLAVLVRPWTGVLLGEVVFIPLLAACAWALVAVSQGGRYGPAAAAGVAGGLATLCRSTLLPAWALVLPMLALARRRARLPLGPVLLVALFVVGLSGLATARNYVASGRVVPIASSFAINFLLGNPPPPGTPHHEDHLLYRWIAMEDPTRMALEGAWHAPGAFVEGLGRKALYALGFFEAYLPGRGWSLLLILTWGLALAGMIALSRSPRRRDPTVWLPAAFAAAHFAAVTLIFPHAHGDRLILPFYVMLLPYAGAAIALAWPRFSPRADGDHASFR